MTLHDMRFEMPVTLKSVPLTIEQATLIVRHAREMGWPSMALAQAFQTDCGLKQKDVIGEWVPTDEPGDSYTISDDAKWKWLHGLRWELIDGDLVLRLTTSQRGKPIERDLKQDQLVMLELLNQYPAAAVSTNGAHTEVNRDILPASGPIIVSEDTGEPWRDYLFRRKWRRVADAAGLPKEVKNG